MLQFDAEKPDCTNIRDNILTSIAAVQLDSHGYVAVPVQRSHAY